MPRHIEEQLNSADRSDALCMSKPDTNETHLGYWCVNAEATGAKWIRDSCAGSLAEGGHKGWQHEWRQSSLQDHMTLELSFLVS
jgi:hypothetical protein